VVVVVVIVVVLVSTVLVEDAPMHRTSKTRHTPKNSRILAGTIPRRLSFRQKKRKNGKMQKRKKDPWSE
jgi:hypothetical protein